MSAAQKIIGTTVACGALLQRAAFAGSCGVSSTGADPAFCRPPGGTDFDGTVNVTLSQTADARLRYTDGIYLSLKKEGRNKGDFYMKRLPENWLRPLLFTLAGAAVGLAYYALVGCSTGTCMITASPFASMAYMGLMGWLLSGIRELWRQRRMQYVIAFLEGVVTFLSPCLLPMLPVYLSYFAAGGPRTTRRTLAGALGFVAGFTAVFVALGALAGTLGGLLRQYQTLVNLVCGGVVILFGLNFLGVLHLIFSTAVQPAPLRAVGSGSLRYLGRCSRWGGPLVSELFWARH